MIQHAQHSASAQRDRQRKIAPPLWGLALLFMLTLAVSPEARAQAPTSLQYPTPVGYIANVSNVYLAPTLSGSTTGLAYSISPALPAGLGFNTATGVISGVPTAAVAATNYTVTATNSFGSTTRVIALTVTNTFFNNARDSVFFNIDDTLRKVGTGVGSGDVILYQNVRTISGQAIDCIVKTVSQSASITWHAYDQPLTTDGSTFSSNNSRFFSPQVEFPTGGGNVVFDFQFIAHGTYNDGTGTGTPVTLQNVQLNTYDIDGNGTALSNQFNKFEGFDTSEVFNSTTLMAPTIDPVTGLTEYKSNISTNNLTVTDAATRVRLTYKNMSSFRIQVGAGAVGRAYFFLDFSSGPTFATPVASTPPTLDLNTTLPGTGNGSSGCAAALPFTAASQTNAASGTPLNALTIHYDNTSANIPDGAGDQLVISGSTAGTSTYSLNFSSNGTANVTVGGVNYTATSTVSGTTNTIAFTNGAGTFTPAQAEALLDALRYDNSMSVPTAGDRVFVVNLRNTQYISPDAVFTATIGCVSISGNIWRDANGLSDGTVNANSSQNQMVANGAYAVLTNSSNQVVASVGISAGGAYTFGRVDPGAYNIIVRNAAEAVGNTVTTATYPTGNYRSTGDNLGAGAGNDGLVNGKLSLTLGTVAITNANFGMQIPPVTDDSTYTNQPNPGGFNYFTVDASAFKRSDADGSVDSVLITGFPGGANYLKVGSAIYTNGGTCPPQSSCTAWPGTGTLRLPVSALSNIAVDPTSAGNTTVKIPFTVLDNGHFGSNNSVPDTVTIPFTVPGSPISISGAVWVDGNANGIKASYETYTAAAGSGQTLYAMLVQTTNTYSGNPTIYTSAAVTAAATGYTFSDVPSGNTYEVRIASLAAAPAPGAAWSTITPALATNYTGVSTNNNGVIADSQSTLNLVNALGVVTASKTAVDFGIEQAPVADAKAFTAVNGAFTADAAVLIGGITSYSILGNNTSLTGSAIKSLSGTDAEDCATASSCTTARRYRIQTIRSNTRLYYFNGTAFAEVLAGSTIAAFDPANLRIHGQSGQGYTVPTALGFTYSLIDSASIASPAVTYTIQTANWPLQVSLVSFSGTVSECNAQLAWRSANDATCIRYEVEESRDGRVFQTVATIASNRSTIGSDYATSVRMVAGQSYYRLKMIGADGTADFSAAVVLRSVGCGAAVVAASPNPAQSSVRITGLTSAARVRVMDATGKVVLEANDVHNNATLDVSRLAAGMYVLQTADASGVSHINLVKQ